ncbi:class I SAM-dependent methyltransferase [Caulobacter sp. KR2-114]|uniref:class I SAM-dependent methyltransferase n=1 Tax=Caulobacter sp. KR2-114 TaxID=3400912 RepID=UPI003C0378C9
MSDRSSPAAFASDRVTQAARATVKAVWWGAAGLAARAITRPTREAPADFQPTAEPIPDGLVRRAWMQAFEKEAGDVALGLYPPPDDGPADPLRAVRRAIDFLRDAREVEARRRRRGGVEARDEAPAGVYPTYYRQNFHFQTGGWFTEDSARRYETQVEALFAGTAGAMRRRALALLAQAWRARDHRGVAILDLACGAGAFLKDLSAAFPRARLAGVDLSPAYLVEAARNAPTAALAQANAERLPFADASQDAVTCVYLFHELPPRVRPVVAAEIARVLRPGGLFAFADSIQPVDEPRLGRLLEAFPAYFHEPFYGTYCDEDLTALFAAAGLQPVGQDTAFLTKAMLFEKVA